MGFGSIPSIHCCNKWEIIESKELLGEQRDNQIQMVCQFVPKLILYKPHI
jgi:hypothetical protein